ncbi:MAG: CYTH domain-containing protein [Dokdonella sp.]
MAREIERKFLLANDDWRGLVERSQRMAQGYLAGPIDGVAKSPRCSVRVRIAGDAATLNIKSANGGIDRAEYEVPMKLTDGEEILATLCSTRVDKIRHYVNIDGHEFEIDEFLGDNAGLIVAELELPSIDATFPRPAWLGIEVSLLRRYYNHDLAAHPYSQWSTNEHEVSDA